MLWSLLVEKSLLQLNHIKSFLLKLVQMLILWSLLAGKLIENGISSTLQAWSTETLIELRLPHNLLEHSVALFLAIQVFFVLVYNDCFDEADYIFSLCCLVDPSCECQVHKYRSHKCSETKEDSRVEGAWWWPCQKWCRNKHAENNYSKSAELFFIPIFFIFLDLLSHSLSESFL